MNQINDLKNKFNEAFDSQSKNPLDLNTYFINPLAITRDLNISVVELTSKEADEISKSLKIKEFDSLSLKNEGKGYILLNSSKLDNVSTRDFQNIILLEVIRLSKGMTISDNNLFDSSIVKKDLIKSLKEVVLNDHVYNSIFNDVALMMLLSESSNFKKNYMEDKELIENFMLGDIYG